MKRVKDDRFILSTGRQIYANRGIIGLSPDLDGISEGYDGGITDFPREPWHEYDMPCSPAEQIEISDFMIDLWGQYKRKVEQHVAKQTD